MTLMDAVMPPSANSIINTGIMITYYTSPVNATVSGIATTTQSVVSTMTTTQTQTLENYMYNPITHLIWMWHYSQSLNPEINTTIENLRMPSSAIMPLNIGIYNGTFIAKWADPLNSVKYYVTTVQYGNLFWYPVKYLGQIPIFIWYMTIPILILALLTFREDFSKFIIAWVIPSYFMWGIYASQYEITFIHHFQFTTPIICMAIPYLWWKVAPKHWITITTIHLFLVAAFFMWFFPLGLIKPF